MSANLIAIQTRRDILVAECAAQRALLAEAWRGLQRPAQACNRAASVARSPWLWAGLGLVLLKLPKRKMLRIPLLLWEGIRIMRRVQAISRYKF